MYKKKAENVCKTWEYRPLLGKVVVMSNSFLRNGYFHRNNHLLNFWIDLYVIKRHRFDYSLAGFLLNTRAILKIKWVAISWKRPWAELSIGKKEEQHIASFDVDTISHTAFWCCVYPRSYPRSLRDLLRVCLQWLQPSWFAPFPASCLAFSVHHSILFRVFFYPVPLDCLSLSFHWNCAWAPHVVVVLCHLVCLLYCAIFFYYIPSSTIAILYKYDVLFFKEIYILHIVRNCINCLRLGKNKRLPLLVVGWTTFVFLDGGKWNKKSWSTWPGSGITKQSLRTARATIDLNALWIRVDRCFYLVI